MGEKLNSSPRVCENQMHSEVPFQFHKNSLYVDVMSRHLRSQMAKKHSSCLPSFNVIFIAVVYYYLC